MTPDPWARGRPGPCGWGGGTWPKSVWIGGCKNIYQDRQTGRQADGKASRQTDRQTVRQADRQMHIEKQQNKQSVSFHSCSLFGCQRKKLFR